MDVLARGQVSQLFNVFKCLQRAPTTPTLSTHSLQVLELLVQFCSLRTANLLTHHLTQQREIILTQQLLTNAEN